MNLIALVLTLAPTAFAATLDPDLTESIIVQNDIDLRKLQAAQAATQAQLDQTRKDLAAAELAAATCHQDCPAITAPAQAPKPKAPAAKKAAPKPDPIPGLEAKITSLEATILDLQGKIQAIPAPTAPYDDSDVLRRLGEQEARVIPAPYDDTGLTDRIVVLETAPAPVVPEATVSYVSNFHPSAYSFVTANFAAPYPGHEDIVGGRLDVGARFLWETPKNLNLGIAIEGGPSTFIGWGIRGGPELSTGVGFGDVSFTAGVGYDCTNLGGLGCEAEHTGGFANVGWEYGDGGLLSFGVRAGMQLAWVTTSAAPEGFYDLNGTLGVGGYFGSLHPKGY